MRKFNLDGLMGMSEMEWALEILLKRAQEHKIPFASVTVSTDDVRLETTGFCQLLARGWLEISYPNSIFIPSKELIERVASRWPKLAGNMSQRYSPLNIKI